jgi:hypothetical protein
MSKRTMVISEGVGSLHGGPVPLREVLYRLYRTVDDTGMVAPSDALGPLEGHLDVGDVAEAVVLTGVDDLVLQLDDGRRVVIALSSTGGHFLVRGVGPDANGLREFAKRYTAAWCNHDARSVARFFAATGSLQVNGGAPAVGRAAITEVASSFMTTFPDLHVQMDDVTPNGERVVYRWTLTGTSTGPGGTGRRVKISGYEDWRLNGDGLIVESLGNFDPDDYRRQLEGT